jgi:hypothetical protein
MAVAVDFTAFSIDFAFLVYFIGKVVILKKQEKVNFDDFWQPFGKLNLRQAKKY